MKYTTCHICNKQIKNCNIKKHLLSHKVHPEYHKQRQFVQHSGLNCIYCDKLCKNKNSLAQHECRCKLNPNRYTVISNLGNYTKQGHTSWNKGLTKETIGRRFKSYKRRQTKKHSKRNFYEKAN